MNYKLFQVKKDLSWDYGFMGLSMMESLGLEVDLSNYDLVYEDDIEIDTRFENVLDELFRIFNVAHPKDYRGRSMSVSDIIEIHGHYYYCDSYGWEKVNKFIK